MNTQNQKLPPVITLSGLANSGKNATLQALARHFPGYALEDCSLIVRAVAKERGIPFEEFVQRVTHEPGFMPDYDRQIDERAAQILREPPVIVAGRIQHWVARGLGIDSFNVCLDASPDVRAERGFRKGGVDHDGSHRRDADDLERYRRMDPNIALPADVGVERHHVHMVISTEDYSPEEVAERIAACARCHANGFSFGPVHRLKGFVP